jgi:hypothetical protein
MRVVTGIAHGIAVVAAVLGGLGPARSAPPLVAFERTGGVAGRLERLVIWPSGEARLRAGAPTAPVVYERALGPRRLAALRTAVAAARIRSVPGGLAPRPGAADGFVYRIETPGGAVIFGDGGRRVPRALGRLAARLAIIVDEAELRSEHENAGRARGPGAGSEQPVRRHRRTSVRNDEGDVARLAHA